MLRSARARTAATVVAIVLAIGLVIALVQLRAATLEAQALERAQAREQFAQEVTTLTTALAEPLHDIDVLTEPTLTALAATLTGTERSPGEILGDLDRSVAQLLAAAGHLEQASQRPLPARPRVLLISEVEPILDRLGLLQGFAAEVAAEGRAAAVAARSYGTAAHRLADAAATFASATEELPETDDPVQLADAWRDELERLGTYRAAIDRAAQAPGLEPVVAVHRDLVDMVWNLAEAAIEDLEEGEVDAYNERLEAALEDQDAEAVREALVAASRRALRGAGITDLEDARARAQALLDALEGFEAELDEALDPDGDGGGIGGM